MQASGSQRNSKERLTHMPTIPDYQSLMLPVLRLVGDRQDHAVAQMRTQLGLQLNLTEAELSERFASGRQTVFSTRVAWAVQFLKQGGTILAVRRGIYKITDRGMSLLNGRPSEITVKTLRQFPEFVEFENRRSGTLRSRRRLNRWTTRRKNRKIRPKNRWRTATKSFVMPGGRDVGFNQERHASRL